MYLLDSNIFIQAKNFYYGFDICPSFWDWMDRAVDGCDARSIVTVYDELSDGNDELAVWIKPRKDDERFLDVSDKPTQQVFEASRQRCRQVSSRQGCSVLAGEPLRSRKASPGGV